MDNKKPKILPPDFADLYEFALDIGLISKEAIEEVFRIENSIETYFDDREQESKVAEQIIDGNLQARRADPEQENWPFPAPKN